MARKPLRPLIRGGGFYPSRKWTPLVYAGGYTTANGGGEPEPPPIEKTVTGNPIHITDALAKPVQALSVKLEPIQDLNGYDSPWPSGGGANKLPPAATEETKTANSGFTVTSYSDGHYHLSKTSAGYSDSVSFDLSQTAEALSGMYFIPKCSEINGSVTLGIKDASNNTIREVYLGQTSLSPISTTRTAAKIYFFVSGSVDTIEADIYPMLADSVLTTYSPYSNICPISGHSSVNVIVSPTLNPSDGTTYPIPLGTTVYGGTLDVVTGVLTITMASITFNGSENWIVDSQRTNRFTLNSGVLNTGEYQHFKANYLVSTMWGINSYTFGLRSDGALYVMLDNTAPQISKDDFKAYLTSNPLQLCYELATPIEVTLTPEEITLLAGENNIWSDGTMTLTYLADGNASEIEALNILLGNRYYNNHEADEPTDREALDILLGGNR